LPLIECTATLTIGIGTAYTLVIVVVVPSVREKQKFLSNLSVKVEVLAAIALCLASEIFRTLWLPQTEFEKTTCLALCLVFTDLIRVDRILFSASVVFIETLIPRAITLCTEVRVSPRLVKQSLPLPRLLPLVAGNAYILFKHLQIATF
jgi:hypothetical protein